MVKALLRVPDGHVLLLGLSAINLFRLRTEPIVFDAADLLGLQLRVHDASGATLMMPLKVAIIAGETEIDLANHLALAQMPGDGQDA